MWNLALFIITVIIIFVGYTKWCFAYWSRRNVVTLKPKLPYGNLYHGVTLGENIAAVYKKFKAEGYKYSGFYLMLRPMWLVIDLNLIKSILTKDHEHFLDHGSYSNEKNDPLTGNLFMLAGPKWKKLRAKLTPTFTSGKMKMMFTTLLDCSRELINVMDDAIVTQTPVDITDVSGRFSTDVIGSCAFGLDCNSLKNPNSKFRIYGKKILQPHPNKFIRQIKAVTLNSFPSVIDFFKIPIFPRDTAQFFLDIVRDTVKYREQNEIVRKDFMHLLIQLKNNVSVTSEESTGGLVQDRNGIGKALTIEQITAQAFVFFLAGFESSSTTLTFCFYELVSNNELQDRARNEVIKIFEKYNGELSYEALSEMVYLEMCINETLRKYPPLPMLSRECTKTYKVDDDLVIEKGTKLFIPLLGIQHDSEYYPQPEKFDPERFSAENKHKLHPFSWLPFGEGPRTCIGQRFGTMQIKVALSVLLKNYKFSLNEKTRIPLELNPSSVTLNAKGNVWLNVEKFVT